MLIKRLLCVVNMINGVNECMGEEIVYAKKSNRTPKNQPS